MFPSIISIFICTIAIAAVAFSTKFRVAARVLHKIDSHSYVNSRLGEKTDIACHNIPYILISNDDSVILFIALSLSSL